MYRKTVPAPGGFKSTHYQNLQSLANLSSGSRPRASVSIEAAIEAIEK